MKKLTLIAAFFLLLMTSATGGFVYRLLEWSQIQRTLTTPVTLPFKAGTSLAQLSQDLEDFQVIDDAFKFQWYVRVFDDYRPFQAGLYQFEGELSPAEIISKFQLGQVFRPVALQLTIPEGFTLKQITERLAANGVGHIVALQNLVRDREFIRSLKIDAPTLEGYLYPATYTFESAPSAQTALARMVQTFFQNLPKDYQKNLEARGLDLHKAVTFASLIELETQLEEEKPLVSEVIWNRLKAKMPLGIDAALIYGIPDYKGDILWSHLSDKSNPYNTRIHIGLPPTAIGSPGVRSLEAVLTPSNFGYLYYVNVPGTTRHHFSKTLKEHNEQVKKLVEATRRSQGASIGPAPKGLSKSDPETPADPGESPETSSSTTPSPPPPTNPSSAINTPSTPDIIPDPGPPPSPPPDKTPKAKSLHTPGPFSKSPPPAPPQKSATTPKGKKSKPIASSEKKKAKSDHSKDSTKAKTSKGAATLKKKPSS
jgi:UPF0755 protein